jgi:hypothetical protein
MPESIVISSLDEATASWIEKEAKRRGVKREEIALHLIRRGIECEHGHAVPQTYDDLDFLAGMWSEEQAAEFMDAIFYFNQVDEKL